MAPMLNRVGGKFRGKEPFGKPRSRWEDNFKIDLLEVGCGGTDWNVLSQDRDIWQAPLNAVM